VYQKVDEAGQIVQFLNSLSQESLDEIGIKDKIYMILDIGRAYVNKEMILAAQEKCAPMNKASREFETQFSSTCKFGLPSPW
jgi:hypothetical protein